MSPADILAWLDPVISNPWLLAIMLTLAPFLSEDAATVGAALLISQGSIHPAIGFGAVNAGILLSDLGLYGAGFLASKVRWIRRLLAARGLIKTRNFIRGNLTPVLISSRFTPGMRLPTYTACGFFKLRFGHFAGVLSVACLLWTAVVFAIVIGLGVMVLEQLGPWKWLGGIAIVIIGIVIPRYVGPWLMRRLGLSKSGQEPSAP